MTRTRRTILALATAAMVGGGWLASCSTRSSDSGGVAVTERDFAIQSVSSAPAGKLRVTVKNEGETTHELVVIRTALDEAALPLTTQGDRVDEAAVGVSHLDPEAEDIAAGKSKTITIELPAGRYVFVCNIAGHYSNGMHAVFTTK